MQKNNDPNPVGYIGKPFTADGTTPLEHTSHEAATIYAYAPNKFCPSTDPAQRLGGGPCSAARQPRVGSARAPGAVSGRDSAVA